MNRRIVKLLTVLLVLLCILPVVAGAAEYQVGDTIWTTGAEPTADTEQYSRWIPVIRADGVQEYREAGKTGVYEYQWIVEEYYGPGKREGIPTSFVVKNVDPQGDPMVGTEFILFEERGENLLLIASAITDEDGVAQMKDLCLDDNSDTAVWHLVQTNFPESKMAESHHPYTGMWDVYVTRDASGEHTLEMESSPAAQTMSLRDDSANDDRQIYDFAEQSGQTVVEENYDEQSKVLTVVNEEIKGEVTVRVEFEDNVVPDEVSVFNVVVMPPDGYKQTLRMTTRYPEVTLVNMPLGDYSFEEQTEKIQVEGYNLKTRYAVQLVGEEAVESQVFTLTEDKTAANLVVTNCYEEISIANTVLAQVVDEEGNLLDGAAVELLDENNNVIRTVSASSEKGTFVFDDFADYAVKDKTVTFKIRQSKAPAGYNICEDQYKITVEKKNGKVTVSAQRDANLLSRLFRSGEETGPNGETVIKFVNEADLGNLSIKIVNQGLACPLESIPITVRGLNYHVEETLSESNGWQVELKDLPMSQYTIEQQADANGYVLVTKYTVSGGFATGNQVELANENAELTITNTYSLQSAKLNIQMQFVDEVIPPALTRIPVTVTGETAYTKTPVEEIVYVAAASDWQATLDLPLGEYTIVQDAASAQVDGYTLTADAETEKVVTLRTEGQQQSCLFTNQYIKNEEPLLEKITIEIQDESQNPVEGVLVGLYEVGGKYPLREAGPSDDKGQIVIADLGQYMSMIDSALAEGGRKEIILKQTEVPEGYELSEQEYTIVVEKTNGELSYGITGVDTSGTEIQLSFINKQKTTETGNLQITVDLGNKPDSVAVDKVTVSVKNAQGAVVETVELAAADNWQKTVNLTVGDYTVVQDAINVTGYKVTTTCSPETVTVKANEMAECTITNQFEESADDSEGTGIPDKIVIEVKDPDGNPIQGCTVAVFMESLKLKDLPKTDANGQVVYEGLKALLVQYKENIPEGETKLALKVSAVPTGYAAIKDVYDIVVQNNNGEISYTISGADITAERILLTFPKKEVEPETGNLQIKVDLGNKPSSVAVDKVTVSVKNAQNAVVETVELTAPEWKKAVELPVGEYTIVQNPISATGYTVETTYSQETITVKANELTECTITNQFTKLETGSLFIEVDLGNKPSSVVVDKVTVSIKNAQGTVVQTVTLTADVNWQATVMDLIVGDYKIVQNTIKATGYKVTPTYSTQDVTIEANQTAECKITNQFTKSSSSSSSSSKKDNQIGIRTLDSNGAPLAGAKYGLFHGATAIRSYTDYGTGQINIEDLDMLLGTYVNDPTIMDTPLTLQQTQPPIGGKRSTKTYDVYVSSATGKVNVKGSEIDSNGVQLVDFIHSADEEENQQQQTQPTTNNNTEEKEPPVIVIRTVDEAGNTLTGAEYCLSTDLRFDKDKDIVYSKANRHDEITIEDLEELLGKEKSVTYYLLQSRQPENGSLSVERYVVELSKKKNDLKVEIKKDAGILERLKGGGVEETTTGEWIVTFSSSAKTTTVQIDYEEIINWNNCLEAPDVLQQYRKNEYEFQMNWEYAGEEKEPLTLKLSNGEKSGTFEPIPYGAKYEIVPVQDGCYKMEFTKGDVKGVASKDNQQLQAKVTYNIDMGKPLTIEMMKIDSRTERPLPGVVYTLKNSEQDEVDTYKTNGSGKLLIDAITEPGEYILTESELPDGYKKLKKDIGISVAVAFKEAQDEKGDPMIVQTLEAVVSHSQVKQHTDGSYRIGTAQSTKIGKLPIILGVSGAVVVAAAGAGVAMLQNKKKKSVKQ